MSSPSLAPVSPPGRLPNVKQPQLPSNPKGEDWRFFIRQFETYCKYYKVDKTEKANLLEMCLGHDGLDLLDGLPEPKTLYEDIVSAMNSYFKIHSSVLLRRREFLHASQGSSESASEFACRLRRLVQDCAFTADKQSLLRDVFVIGIKDSRLGERLLAEDPAVLTFENALQKAEAWEMARSDRGRLEHTSVNRVNVSKSNRSYHASGNSLCRDPPRKESASFSNRSSNNSKVCYRCGSQAHLANSSSCPALNKACNKCKKTGHFSKMCHSKPTSKVVQSVDVVTDYDQFKSHSDCSPSHAEIFSVDSDSKVLTRDVQICDLTVRAIVDTGASVNIISASIIPEHCSSSLREADRKPVAWGQNPLRCKGIATLSVQYRARCVMADFHVCEEKGPTLLSLALCKQLGIVHVDDNVVEISSVFEGPSCVPMTKACKILLKADAVPKSYQARRLPSSLHEPVRKHLESMVNDGIIQPVTEPSDWCSPLLVATKKFGDVRRCVDFRYLNSSIRLTSHAYC